MKSAAPRRAIDQVLELATRLPWWGGLLSALASYMLLYPIATLQVPTPTGGLNVVATALGQLLVILAGVGQYLLPLAFLVAATISAFGRWKRSELCESVMQDASGSILRGLTWTDFDLLVSEAFHRRGYEVSALRGDLPASYTRLELTRSGLRFLVDCTDWRSWKAGAATLRNLHQQIKETGAAGGFAVTSGRFTPEARHFAAGKDIELVDGRHLKKLLRAEPQPAEGDFSVSIAGLRSILERTRELVPTVRTPSRKEPHVGKPERRNSLKRRADAGFPAICADAHEQPFDSEDAEAAAGRQLTALVRDERREERGLEHPLPPVRRRRPQRFRPRWKLPRMEARRIADALGILAALSILWSICAWFLQLPTEPEDTPWALLGTDSDSEALLRHLQGLGNARSAAEILEGKRPLGQYRFGPPPDIVAAAKPQIPLQEEEPVEIYHSLRELETAFDAKYVPPPECYAYGSNNLLVKCGNHRIRARRGFIASGGKVTPMLFGSWEEPRVVVKEARPQDWRHYEQDASLQDSTRKWDRELREQGGWDSLPESDQGDALNPGPDERLEVAPEPVTFGLQSGPTAGTQWNWQRGYKQEPQPVRRAPQPEKPVVEVQQEWRRQWARDPTREPDGDWRREWVSKPPQDSAGDWRRGQSQAAEEDRSRDWEPQPLPVERRHWVDDL